jgi:trans-2,3-dihydro-3-hydroxyanthranilate isomerase
LPDIRRSAPRAFSPPSTAIEPGPDGTTIVLEEKVGPVATVVRRSEGRLHASFELPRLPAFGPEPPGAEALARLISISPEDIGDDGFVPRTASAGVPYLFIPVRDRKILARVRVDHDAWTRELSSFWAPHLFVFTRDTELSGSTLRARMFAPAMGITEDPATGAAAAAIARCLALFEGYPAGHHHWRIEQGMEMGRPSTIDVFAHIDRGDLTAVRIGGSTVIIGEGMLYS